MPSKRQKRAQRMRARQHQQALQGTNRIVIYDDGTEIAKLRGRRPQPGYHRSDPPKHGDRLDARGQLIKDLRDVGITEPTGDMLREYSRLLKRSGSDRHVAKKALEKNLERTIKRFAEDVQAQVKIEAPVHPTPEKWEGLVAKSKRRKRGVAKFAEKAGFELIANADPKKRESWVKA